MTNTIYIDRVAFTDGSPDEEVRGYLGTEHSCGWLVWVWSDSTLRIPAHRIRDVITSEEDGKQ